MNRKQFISKMNTEKGIAAADVVIALLMIVTAVGVISMVYINLVINSREVDRKTGATRIATNIIENMSQKYYDQLTEQLEILEKQGTIDKSEENKYIIPSGNPIFNTTIPNGYTVEIGFENSYSGENTGYDLVKKATVKVKYHVDGKEKEVELNKVFEREIVRECNSPNFSEEYIRQIVPEDEYLMYSNTAENSGGAKIICPIQYDKLSQTYKIVTNTEDLWYSYSNKQWARVLVLDPEEVGNITNEMMEGENSYVWVPRFGVGYGEDKAYFQYKATNYAISNSYYDEPQTNLIYHYIDTTEKKWSNVVNFEEGSLGKWCSYSEIFDPVKRKRCLQVKSITIWTNVGILENISNSVKTIYLS